MEYQHVLHTVVKEIPTTQLLEQSHLEMDDAEVELNFDDEPIIMAQDLNKMILLD